DRGDHRIPGQLRSVAGRSERRRTAEPPARDVGERTRYPAGDEQTGTRRKETVSRGARRMALLTDRDLITVRDLVAWENDLLETADRERVEIETKIDLGTAEVRTETETEVEKILRSSMGSVASIASIRNVVATPSLLRWVHSRILALFYFECF